MHKTLLRTRSMLTLGTVIAGSVILFSGSPSWADGQHGYGSGHGHGSHRDAATFVRHILKAKEAVGLSEEQETQLRTIGATFMKDRVRRSADIELAEIDMHQLMHTKPVKSEEVESAIRKVYGLKADLRVSSFKAYQEAKSVLTPDQLKKLRELRDHRSTHGERAEIPSDDREA